ncbi:hypothetical protein HZ326_0664 [Fusarium oxysporum f. sp. albedinis]|nr:hypothetical protein HZ326_0664 [Fusarium oxysporum f. sp. albedinis]
MVKKVHGGPRYAHPCQLKGIACGSWTRCAELGRHRGAGVERPAGTEPERRGIGGHGGFFPLLIQRRGKNAAVSGARTSSYANMLLATATSIKIKRITTPTFSTTLSKTSAKFGITRPSRNRANDILWSCHLPSTFPIINTLHLIIYTLPARFPIGADQCIRQEASGSDAEVRDDCKQKYLLRKEGSS